MIRKVVKNIERSIVSLYNYCIYLCYRILERCKYGNYYFPYCERLIDKRVYVLANGPSLNKELSDLLNNAEFLLSSKFVLNSFVETDLYFKLKPEFYCIADPGFFTDGERNSYLKSLIVAINERTSWNISLFVPYEGLAYIQKFITNKIIKIIPISSLLYKGFDKFKYMAYKNGVAVPSFVNVTIMIEYILLNLGCKDIRLYGVDHTFTDGLAVDSDNYLCLTDKHFYGVNIRRVTDWTGHNLTVAEYLFNKGLTFKEHENMRGYADYLGAQIINCTKRSMIDAYVRLEQLEKNKN